MNIILNLVPRLADSRAVLQYGSRVWTAALPAGSEGASPGGFEGAGNATYYTTGTVNSGCQHAQNEGYGAGNCKTVDATGVVYAVFMHYPDLDDATRVRTLTLKTPVVKYSIPLDFDQVSSLVANNFWCSLSLILRTVCAV